MHPIQVPLPEGAMHPDCTCTFDGTLVIGSFHAAGVPRGVVDQRVGR